MCQNAALCGNWLSTGQLLERLSVPHYKTSFFFQSFLTDTVSMQGRSALDNVEMAYARQVLLSYNVVYTCDTVKS